jgi:hypothetical protein
LELKVDILGMNKFSIQNKSFIFLLAIIIVGSAVSAGLIKYINKGYSEFESASNKGYTVINHNKKTPEVKNAVTVPPVDTSTWKTYKNEEFNFSFLYNPGWTVKPAAQKGEYTVIEIDPGKKYFNIQIYISKNDYYIMDGLNALTEQINKIEFKNVNNMLFGTFKEPYYFTLDLGKSVSLLPEFYALVHSLKF